MIDVIAIVAPLPIALVLKAYQIEAENKTKVGRMRMTRGELLFITRNGRRNVL